GVEEIISTYKDMVSMMQDSFEYQLRELTAEKERIGTERMVLKKQLQDELDKNRETIQLQHQYEELLRDHERAIKELEVNCFERQRLEQEYKELSREYEEFKIRQKEELNNKQESVSEGVPEGESVRRMMIQLEEMTRYCEVMEEEQKNLEDQLRSMKTIGEELSRMSEKYDQSRSELNEARKKYMSLQRENQSMNQEMESASQIIAEIMEQFERKEKENTELRQQLREYKQQLMTVKKEKLESDTAYVLLMELNNKREEELQKSIEELEAARSEAADLKRRNKELENNKIIRIQAGPGAGGTKQEQPEVDNQTINDQETDMQKMKALLERAESVSKRLSGEEVSNTKVDGADSKIEYPIIETEVL
ncbi:MAG: hypothetical protein ACLTJE_26895, partial [Enterocloster bolteae]